MKIGERGRPLSTGCSSTYSAPASRAAVRMATVRRTTSFADASSRACLGSTLGMPKGCSRLRMTGGPPSGEELDRKCRETRWRRLSTEATRRPPRTHRQRSVGVVAGKRSPSRYHAHLLRRRLGVYRWCRILSQTGRGRQQCRPGDGTVRRKARGRDAIGKRRQSHGQ
eukprot:4795561-Pleurochrysis_carterae.AAC.2